MQPLPVGETGVATARASVGEGDHPICTEWSEAERRKIGDTPMLGEADPCRREGGALSSLRGGVIERPCSPKPGKQPAADYP